MCVQRRYDEYLASTASIVEYCSLTVTLIFNSVGALYIAVHYAKVEHV